MSNQLQNIIDLCRKTGDRIVVFDPRNSSQAYVVLPVRDYEKIAINRSSVKGLTEDGLIDKINRDIAIWKSDFIEQNILENKSKNSKFKKFTQEKWLGNDEEGVWADEEEIWAGDADGGNEDFYEDSWHSIKDVETNKNKIKNTWNIPKERKEKAEEVIEEDMFYLENVE